MIDIKELQEKLKQNPNDYKLMEEYAIALSDIGENEEALKNFLYLKEMFPDNGQILYNIGIILEKLKYIDDSISAYEKALSIDSSDLDVKYNLANAYIKKKEFHKAEPLLLDVLKKDNLDSNTHFHLGEIYSKLNRHEESIKHLLKAVELNNSDVIAVFYLAYEYSQIGQIDKSIQAYENVISLSPDYSWAYYNLASIYLEQGNDDKAIFYLERTIKTNPNDIPAIKLLVKILSKNKKYNVAETILKRATTSMPLEADLYYLLAQVYKCLNSKMNYLKYLRFTSKKSSTFTGNIDKLKEEISIAEQK